MARWMKPEEELPECDEGERIVMIVRERDIESLRAPMVDRLVIIAKTRTGWHSTGGFTPPDAILWTYEKDLVKIAEIACPKLM